MKSNEFKIGTKVIHTYRKEWGVGNIIFTYADNSIIVHFPEKANTHPDGINKFRYYEQGLKYFTVVG